MRYSCAAFRILQKRYVSVLKKCALINAGLFFLAAPAMATDWADFVDAVIGGQTEIDISDTYVDRTVFDSQDIGTLGKSTPGEYQIIGAGNVKGIRNGINGNNGTLKYANPIEVVTGQTLTLHNINQYNFSQFITNNGGHVIIKQEGEYDSAYHNNTGTALANTGGTMEISGTDIYENGGGIANTGGTVTIADSTISNNEGYNGAAIVNNTGTIVIENTTFEGNHTTGGSGGAIDTWGEGSVTTIIDSSFENNHANDAFNKDAYEAGNNGDNTASAGGAINNNEGATLNIVAQNKNVEFTGNYVGSIIEGTRPWEEDVDNRFSNAITNNGTINLNAAEDKSIIFNDSISYAIGKNDYNKTININKSDVELKNSAGETIATPTEGTILVNNYIYDQTINLYGGTLKFGYYDGGEDWQNGIGGLDNASTDFNIHGGTISLQDGIGRYEADSGSVNRGPVQWGQTATLHSDFNLAIDAIFAGQEDGHDVGADMFQTGSLKDDSEGNDHKIILSDINLGANTKYNGTAVTLDEAVWDKIVADENTKLQSTAEGFANKNHLTAWNKDTGILKVGDFTLQDAVAETSGERYYTLNSTENVTEDLGDMTNGSLTIAGKGNNITAQPADKTLSGITVGKGDALTINDVANMSGFATALNITGGKTTVNNSTLSENDTALNVASGASITLNDTNIKDNLTNGIINAGAVNLNATAGESAENKNTVTVDNTRGTTDAGKLENTGKLNLNAFANAIIDIKDKITGAASAIANNIVNINSGTAATGEVKLADIDNQTVNIAQGTVTAGAISGSAVNVTAGNVTAGNISSSDVTAESATDSLTIASVDNSTVTTSATKTEINGTVDGSTVTNNAGTATIKGAVSGSTVDVQSGSATLESDVKEKSEIKVAAGASATIKGAVNASTVTSKGTTTIAGATSGESTVDVQGGETTISAAVTGSELKVSGGTLTVAATGKISEASKIFVSDNGNADINGNVDSSEIAVTGGKADFVSVTGSRADIDGGETTIASIAKSENGTRSTIEQTAGTLNLGNTVTNTDITNNGGTLNLGTSGQGISLAGSTIASGTANLLASTITGGANGAFTIDTGATLATTKETTIAASINGNGTISATGNKLTFSTNDNATGSAFTGTISAGNSATVNLDSSYGLSTDATVSLNNSILNYNTAQTMLSETTLSNESMFNIALNNGATANINGTGREEHNIALSDKFWSVEEGTGAINFNNAHYTLGASFTTGTDSTATFNNADISLAGQNSSFGNIALKDSTLLLSEKGKRNPADSYTFGSLVSADDSNNLHIDVDLGLAAATDDPEADKIVITGESSGLLNITELFITDDSGMIDENGKTIQILDIQKELGESEDHLKLKAEDGLEILSWATNVYEYGVVSETQKTDQDSIKISLDRPSSTDTLRDLNRYNINKGEEYNHNRGFNFIADKNSEDEIANTVGSYNIYRDLDATAAGNFTISGKNHTQDDGTVLKSVLSGKLENLIVAADNDRLEANDDGTYNYDNLDDTKEEKVQASNVGEKDITFAVGAMGNDSGEDARGSMFEIVNETKFTIRDVSVENALRTENDATFDRDGDGVADGVAHGAAIYADNADAEVTLENTDFKNNEVQGGNGGAIANISSKEFNIANALFSGNKASANGGAIYNADVMTINGATFENNAAQNGGAIYNDKDATMTITAEADEESGKSGLVQFTANATTGADGKGGAIYNAGTLNLKADKGSQIIVAAATKTAGNDIYNAGTLNLNELKAESGENDEDAAGEIKLNSLVTNTADAELNINNGTVALINVTNDGTLNINGGEVTLNGAITAALDSNNAATSGALNINGGSLTLAESASITQKTMSIGKGVEFSANADQLKISEELNNAGTLTFTGGDNKNAINNNGTLIYQTATNEKVTNSGAISGTGTTTITGDVENTGGGYYTKSYYDC